MELKLDGLKTLDLTAEDIQMTDAVRDKFRAKADQGLRNGKELSEPTHLQVTLLREDLDEGALGYNRFGSRFEK